MSTGRFETTYTRDFGNKSRKKKLYSSASNLLDREIPSSILRNKKNVSFNSNPMPGNKRVNRSMLGIPSMRKSASHQNISDGGRWCKQNILFDDFDSGFSSDDNSKPGTESTFTVRLLALHKKYFKGS